MGLELRQGCQRQGGDCRTDDHAASAPFWLGQSARDCARAQQRQQDQRRRYNRGVMHEEERVSRIDQEEQRQHAHHQQPAPARERAEQSNGKQNQQQRAR